VKFSSANEKDINYPRDIFCDIIREDSPYGFYIFQWIDYHEEAHTYRLKMPHDVRLKTGEILEGLYPNGNGWHGAARRIDDNEVEAIRLSKKLAWTDHTWRHPAEKD